jgi:hypothetical protein
MNMDLNRDVISVSVAPTTKDSMSPGSSMDRYRHAARTLPHLRESPPSSHLQLNVKRGVLYSCSGRVRRQASQKQGSYHAPPGAGALHATRLHAAPATRPRGGAQLQPASLPGFAHVHGGVARGTPPRCRFAFEIYALDGTAMDPVHRRARCDECALDLHADSARSRIASDIRWFHSPGAWSSACNHCTA